MFNQINSIRTAIPRPLTRNLCKRCEDLNFSSFQFRIEDDTTSLAEKSQICDLCGLLYRASTHLRITGKISLYREVSTLRMPDIDRPVLSLCRDPQVATSLEDIQIGFPDIRHEESDARFRHIREWLKDCNDNHSCFPKKLGTLPTLPTRAIAVGSGEDSETVQLCDTRGQCGKYIALSHRWGNTKTNPPFSTNRYNIDGRMRSIKMKDLPATFKDAVKVTRKLGIPYLWIDSICIIQGSDGDWDEQAKLMEDVFSGAYCVIAATQASGTSDGFLKPPSPREFVALSDGLESCIYVCEPIDDFDQHVAEADLNTRGWVYQERALARRTIHFAKQQTYWECGDGVRCETLTKMKKYATQPLSFSHVANSRIIAKQHCSETRSSLRLRRANRRGELLRSLRAFTSNIRGLHYQCPQTGQSQSLG